MKTTRYPKADGSTALKKGKEFVGTIPAPSVPPTASPLISSHKVKSRMELAIEALQPLTLTRQWTDCFDFTTTEISVGQRFPNLDEQALFRMLLTVGGEKAVVASEPECHVAFIFERGYFSPEGFPAKLKKGRPNNCHDNSARLWKAGKGKLMTGYALSVDGLWRQHSWVEATKHIIETTTLRTRYFGFELSEEESMQFYKANNY